MVKPLLRWIWPVTVAAARAGRKSVAERAGLPVAASKTLEERLAPWWTGTCRLHCVVPDASIEIVEFMPPPSPPMRDRRPIRAVHHDGAEVARA
jgi:hypothetical protein